MIYTHPPKLPYSPVFILVNLSPFFSGHEPFLPAKLGALDSLVDFQALRLSYILLKSLESTALHPYASLPSFSKSHWCFHIL
jgi:hypothetical protein